MKKVISIFMCIVLALSISSSAFAVEIDMFPNDLEMLPSHYTIDTEFPDVVQAEDGAIALLTDNGESCQPVGRLDIDVTNDEEVNSFLARENISDEVKDYISNLAEHVRTQESDEAIVATFFSPDLLRDSRAAIEYKVYKNVQMKTERVYVYNISSGFQFAVHGDQARGTAESITNVVLGIAGNFSTVISLGGTMLSLFQAATNGIVHSATSKDFTQLELIFDGTTQWTYATLNGQDWITAYVSQKVTINEICEYQQFVVNNVGQQKRTYQHPNETVKSPGFDDPWDVAYYSIYSPTADWAYYTVGNDTWWFDMTNS